MTRRTIAALALLLVAASVVSFAQGLYWESNTTSPMLKDKTLHSTFAYMPGMMRQASPENGTATIFRLDRKVIISVNERNQTYSEMTFDEIEARLKEKGAGADKQMEAMKEKMKGLPEEQRKMMEKAMGGKMPGGASDVPVTVTTTTETKTISGYTCTQYVVHQGEKTVMSIWATKAIAGYAEMQKELSEFGRRMASLNAANGTSLADAMKQVIGFPIQTQIGETLTTTVMKVESRATPANAFEVPAGYQKTPSPYLQH
jgi:hypothetical protein